MKCAIPVCPTDDSSPLPNISFTQIKNKMNLQNKGLETFERSKLNEEIKAKNGCDHDHLAMLNAAIDSGNRESVSCPKCGVTILLHDENFPIVDVKVEWLNDTNAEA